MSILSLQPWSPPQPWLSSQPHWKHLIYTPLPYLQNLLALGSGYCQETEQARKGRILFMVCLCMCPPPNVIRRVRGCEHVCVHVPGNEGEHICVCTENTPQCVQVCVHESVCARGGGSNCTFGLLAPGAPLRPRVATCPQNFVR